MIKQIVGGAITLVIGGTAYTISQSSVVNNFKNNTGMSQQQAQSYVQNAQQNSESFTKAGQQTISNGNAILSDANQIDCADYTYTWTSASLTCQDGQEQLQAVGNDAITAGNCLTTLGNGSGSIQTCINNIDTVISDIQNATVLTALNNGQPDTTDINSLQYDKSVLQAALQSN